MPSDKKFTNKEKTKIKKPKNINSNPPRKTFRIFTLEIIGGTLRPIKKATKEGTVKNTDPAVLESDRSFNICR